MISAKRKDYINWEDYFMNIALLSAQRSKDPSTQVGSCIVNNENKIIGIGYNGFPTGISDNKLPWSKTATDILEQKYLYVCHAEMNAIQNSTIQPKNCKIYVTLFPCNECAKLIIQAGIKEVIYLSDKYKDTKSTIASKKMFDLVGIPYRQLEMKKQLVKN